MNECEMTEEIGYSKGIRACFDYLISRAAASYHGNPEIQKQIDYDNNLIENWAEDMLEEVDLDSYSEWCSINKAYAKGVASVKV
jgi:hypothetical protein